LRDNWLTQRLREFSTMTDALIIDACRTPCGIGKAGKGALADIHPHRLGAAVLKALVDRTGMNTADVDDVVWGTNSQRGVKSYDLGRMSALDTGYDVRSSGVTRDRFCGSGITAVALAAASIMSGMEALVVAGGTEMMSVTSRRSPDEGPRVFDNGNLHLRGLHPQLAQGGLVTMCAGGRMAPAIFIERE
jgi:acetyl-CoA C-acetyltransferase